MNSRQQKERRRDRPFVAFVCFCRLFSCTLVIFWSVCLTLSAGELAAESPKHGGILRIARPTETGTLDPVKMPDFILYGLLHLPLIDLINGTNLVPCAAKAWSASSDYRVFTIHLRPGVKFSNGRDVVVDDYIYTLERMLSPSSGFGFASNLGDIAGAKAFAANKTSHLTGVKALSTHTFRVELEKSNPAFPLNLWFPAMPREEIVGHEDRYGIRPVCTGPYMVEEWIRGARLKLTRNPHYQGPEPQHFDGVEVLFGGDETTHQMMFERGELDVSNGIPRPSFRRLVNHPHWGKLVERTQLFDNHSVILNTEIAPLNLLLVRRAINHAIDRDRRMGVASGLYTHAEGVIPPIMPGYNPDLRGYPFNPEQARKLLQQAGMPLPLHTQLWHDTSDEMRTLAQGIQWDLGQVGIEVELVVMSINQLISASTVRGKVPMMLLGWSPLMPDPMDILGIPFDGNAVTNAQSLNQAFYNNPEVTRLLHEAAIQGDLQLRLKLYRQAEAIIVSDAPWAFLGHQNNSAIRQPWLKGSPLDSLWIYRFDRLWFEK